MEVERISGIRYFRAHEAEVLHDTKHNYRPRTIPKSTVASSPLYVPLLYVSLNVNVVNTTSRTTLTHIFTNGSDQTIPEATYVFPLYAGATVVSFTCWVGPNTIRSSVETKTKARDEYLAAISQKDVAMRLEEHTSEIFETSLGNIPPRTDVRIEITYINELKPDISGEGLLVTIPAFVAPRYGTPPEGYTKNRSSSLQAHKGLDIRIDVSAPVPIRRLDPRNAHVVGLEFGSAGQPVQSNNFGDLVTGPPAVNDHKRVRATLSHRTPVLNGDFILLIVLQDPVFLKPRAVMEVCPRYPGTSAIRVSFRSLDLFTPRAAQHDVKDEIIFIVDRSGSMVPKISSLKKSMDIFFTLLWPKSKSYDQTTRDEALKHLDTFKADMGGTEILRAIDKAVKSRNTDTNMRTEILILTDGEVWQEDETIEYVRSTREKLADSIRFFALGVGDAVSHKLIEGIGRHGGGFADVLTVYSPGSWDRRLLRMLKGALSPSSWTCDIFPVSENEVFPKRRSPERPFIKAPYKIPRLLDCTQTTCYILIENSDTKYDSVTIQGTSSGGKDSTVDIPVERVEVSEPMILALAVKAILNDMETGRSQLHDEAKEKKKLNATAADTYVRRFAEQLGKKWSLTSKWTSFVGVNSSSVEKYLTRIYRTNRNELAELTGTRRGNHLFNQRLTHEVDPRKDRYSSNEEEKDESSSSDSSGGGGGGGGDCGDDGDGSDGGDGGDNGDGGDGNDGNNWETGGENFSDNGDNGGRGGNEQNGESRDTPGGRNNHRGDEDDTRGDINGHTGESGDGRGKTQGREHGDREEGGSRSNERGNTDSVGQSNDHLTRKSGTNYRTGESPPFWSKWFQVGDDAAETTHGSKDPILKNMSDSIQEKKTLFLDGSGIRKDVLMAEIEGALGPDTTIRTGSNEEIGGYWITAGQCPGKDLIHTLKIQTEKWNEEIKESGNDLTYRLSKTYKSKHSGDTPGLPAIELESRSEQAVLSPVAIKTTPPEFRKIISCYEYSGCFSDSPDATSVFNCLLESVNPGTKTAILSHLRLFRLNCSTEPKTLDHQQHEFDDRVCRTVMSAIYIKKAYPTFEELWQLIIHKAEAWVESLVHHPKIWTELERIYVANWIGSEVHEDNSLKVDEDLLLEAYNSTNLPSSVPDLVPQHEDPRSLQNAFKHEPPVNQHSKPAPRHKSRRKETSSTRAKEMGDDF